MNKYINEDSLEQSIITQLVKLGYRDFRSDSYTKPNSKINQARGNDERNVILSNILRRKLVEINPGVRPNSYDNAIRQIRLVGDNNDLIIGNHKFHDLLINGIKVPYIEHSVKHTDTLYPIDFDHPLNNDFIVTNQFTNRDAKKRRPDITLFVNGLPLVNFELKDIENEHVGLRSAYRQLQTYKHDIKHYMEYNEILIVSDGLHARAGSLSANFDRFMVWRSPIHNQNDKWQSDILVKYMLNKPTLLNIIRNFILFEDHQNEEPVKILAAYHQYYMVNKAVERAKHCLTTNDTRIGTVWHTQGSGKSLAMVFFTEIVSRKLGNPTFVVLNDRIDLDDQLESTFASASKFLNQMPKRADSRNDLRQMLTTSQSGGIIFTTIQKFSPDENESRMPALSKRSDVIVIADEAHRSQYGLKGHFNLKSGQIKYGFAKYMRNALPNASFIGFTGTPLRTPDRNTFAVFGRNIDTYDMTQSVRDGGTVKIYYESRVIPLRLRSGVEKKYRKLLNESGVKNYTPNQKRNHELTKLDSIAGSKPRVQALAKDFVHHFEARYQKEYGKSILVVMSRQNAVRVYNAIVALRPKWASNDLKKGVIKVVITSSSADDAAMQKHRTNKHEREILQQRMKDPNDPLKIVIVVDMWLTGFDCPPLNTLYIDKPMQGHNLMQAISRVNRVFKDKKSGLVVDYIGIADSLKNAMREYSPSDQKQVGIDVHKLVKMFKDKYEAVKTDFMNHINYKGFSSKNDQIRIQVLRIATDYLLGLSDYDQRKFCDAITWLQHAESLLITSSPFVRSIGNEIAFFVAVKRVIQKSHSKVDASIGNSDKLNYQLRQWMDQSVIPGKVVDLYGELGLKRPNIGLLSDSYLASVSGMSQKNLALALMKRLLNGQIHALYKTNITKANDFFETLRKAIEKYNQRNINTEKVLQDLVALAKNIRREQHAGKKLNLSPEEQAFYSALANHKEAVKVMGSAKLRKLAEALVKLIRQNIGPDWQYRSNVRAQMRINVKKLLYKYGYPPDFSRDATKQVVKQAETLAKN